MSDIDVSKLSNDELMALLQGGQQIQPTNAQTGQPLNPAQAQGVGQYAAAGGFDPSAEPGTARKPFAQTEPGAFPDQGQFFFDQQGKVQQVPKSDLGIMQGIDDRVRAFARGVPIAGAAADELNAASAALIAPALEPFARNMPGPVQSMMGYDPRKEIGDLKTFGERYGAAKNLQRFEDQRFDDARPKESMGLQIGGGIAGTVAALPALGGLTAAAGPEAGLLLRSGAGAVEGAGIGAAHGYLAGEGDFGDPNRLKGAGMGAAFGGAAGAALPVATHVAGQGWRATGGRLVDALRGERQIQGPVPEEAGRLAAVLRGEESPAAPPPTGEAAAPQPRQDVEAALVSAQREPVTARASEVDDAYVRIARALERGRQTPEGAAEGARSLGPFGVLADTSPAAQDLLRAAINRPGKGAGIAKDNLTPRQQGVFNKEAGEYDIRPSSLRITDKAAEGLGLGDKQYGAELDAIIAQRKANADPLYAKMRAAPPVSKAEFSEFSASPVFEDAYQGARAISQKAFVRQADGTEKIVPLPAKAPEQLDWRTLDLMKQAMDDTISTAPQQGIGASSRGASKGYLQRFVAKLDELNPDYRAARESFAGDTAMKDALEEGRKLLREDAYSVGKKLSELTESERQMTRLGALQELRTKLGNANVTFDAANQAGLLKPNQLARFRELFPDRKAFGEFVTTLENERQMFGTSGAAFGNSTTAKQILNVMEPSDPQLEGAGQAVAGVAGGNPLALIQAIRRMGMESPMREGVAETIASVLTNHDQAALPEVVRRLTDAQKAAMVADILRNSQGAAAGQAAGRMAQPGQ